MSKRSIRRPSTGPMAFATLVLALAGCATVRPIAAPATRPTSAPATQPADPALAAIRDEGLNRSKIADTADYLCNVIGPRLTGSPALRRANDWTRDTLTAWGLIDAHLEPWGPFGRGWTALRCAVVVDGPSPFTVAAVPKAWSPGLGRPVEAEAIYLDAKTEPGLDEYADRLAGKVVLIGRVRTLPPQFTAPATRYTDAQLAEMETPPKEKAAELMQATPTPATTAATSSVTPPATTPGTMPSTAASTTSPASSTAPASPIPPGIAFKALAFAAKHGAACVITPSPFGEDGTVFVAQAAVPDPTPRKSPTVDVAPPAAWWPDAGPMPPQIVVSPDHFNRVVSLLRHGEPVRIGVDLKVHFTDERPQQYDTIAEIPGGDLADQIVMIGAHLDSWHGGTGATDNGAGVVAVMEAVRLIQAAGLKPRRTIRIALWTGEEQGLLGSIAYVKAHFGSLPTDAATTRPATNPAATTAAAKNPVTQPAPPVVRPARPLRGPEYDKLSVYFNLDNGTGKIRGVFAQHDTAAIPIFKAWLAPLADLGATAVAPGDTGFTDHVPFDRIGLPGFQFIQDPIEYFTRTHHSTIDTYERLQIDDLKQAAVVMATLLWDAANADERFPRKSLGP